MSQFAIVENETNNIATLKFNDIDGLLAIFVQENEAVHTLHMLSIHKTHRVANITMNLTENTKETINDPKHTKTD